MGARKMEFGCHSSFEGRPGLSYTLYVSLTFKVLYHARTFFGRADTTLSSTARSLLGIVHPAMPTTASLHSITLYKPALDHAIIPPPVESQSQAQGSIVLRAMKSMRSLARMKSWAALSFDKPADTKESCT